MSENSIQIDGTMRQRVMQALQNDDQYAEILEQLQDLDQVNECAVNDKVYRIKRGFLPIYERNQPE